MGGVSVETSHSHLSLKATDTSIHLNEWITTHSRFHRCQIGGYIYLHWYPTNLITVRSQFSSSISPSTNPLSNMPYQSTTISIANDFLLLNFQMEEGRGRGTYVWYIYSSRPLYYLLRCRWHSHLHIHQISCCTSRLTDIPNLDRPNSLKLSKAPPAENGCAAGQSV